MKPAKGSVTLLEQRSPAIVILVVAVAVLVLTWVGIRESRSDSFRLLVSQGTAFTTSLAEASRNALEAERVYDRLVQRRYSDLVTTLLGNRQLSTSQGLYQFVRDHELLGAWLFERDSSGVIRSEAGSARVQLPEFVRHEADTLALSPVPQFVQLMDEQEERGQVAMYYLELTDSLNRVVILAADGKAYQSALYQTGIGYLAQRMAREEGVEYIIYQATDGIIFASRKPGELLAIESDPFLQATLKADTTTNRIYDFLGERVLELVHPFSTVDYPEGVFRVGLSLRGFDAVSRGFDWQMIILSIVMVGLTVIAILYLDSRRKRRELSKEYTQIKSLTDQIFDRMETGVAIVDNSGIIRFTNAALESALGRKGLSGKHWKEAVGDARLEQRTQGEATRGELEVTVGIGETERILLVAWSRVELEGQSEAATVVVVYDITNLRKFERDASRRERLSEMGNLAAGVAHEIRNPLNTISIAAQRLATEFSPTEHVDEFTQFTQSIRTETKRLNEIITRFLALARDEQKRRQRIDLRATVEESLRLVHMEAAKLGITLSVAIPAGIMVEADPDSLKQVFLNLFNNSKEAAGGKPIGISIVAEQTENAVTIRFSDTGPGILLEVRDKIFTPYFTTKEAGTGLGLPTVHKIVTAAGGDIRLDETHPGGATFVMTFPITTQ